MGSLSQPVAHNEVVYNLRECLCFSQRFTSPRMALFPGVSGFSPPFTKPHTSLKQQELVLQSKRIPPGILHNKDGGLISYGTFEEAE